MNVLSGRPAGGARPWDENREAQRRPKQASEPPHDPAALLLYSFRAARGVAAGRSVGAQIQNLRGQILHSAVCCEVYCFRVHTSPSNRLAEPARQPPDLDYENGSGTKAAPVL